MSSPPSHRSIDNALQVQNAAISLASSFEHHKARWSETTRFRLAWIPKLAVVASHARQKAWSELSDCDAKQLGSWKRLIDNKEDTSSIPDWDTICKHKALGRLLVRSFTYYEFYLRQIKQEHETENVQRRLEGKKSPRDDADWLCRKNSPCNNVVAEQWESPRVADKTRQEVFLLIGANADPKEPLEQIVKATTTEALKSLGRQAPMGRRQEEMYYGRARI